MNQQTAPPSNVEQDAPDARRRDFLKLAGASGQMLIVTAGQGWVQEDSKERRIINPGDVVWIPAGVKHWHGATTTSPMAHIAVSYMHDGKNVDWFEPVSDEQYR